jgi:uncharacterized membrane protein
MNTAHFHLLVNHFPIVGLVISTGIFLVGIVRKNNSLQQTAYVLFILVACAAAVSMNTGEGAEEIAENFAQVTHHLIHEHEEWAEKFALLTYLLAVGSMVNYYFSIKKNALQNKLNYVLLLIALGACLLSKPVGTSGGEIRHTEIRTESQSQKQQGVSDEAAEEHEEN